MQLLRIFIGFQWILVIFQFAVSAFIPDVPHEVEMQLQRQEFIVSKVIDKTPDEDFGEEEESEDSGIASKSPLPATGALKKRRSTMTVKSTVMPTFDYPHVKPAGGWPKPMTNQTFTLNV